MTKSLVFALALLAFESKSFAYGVRTVEHVSVQSVSCDYKVVTIQTRFSGKFTVIQNLTPLLVNAEFINTSSGQGRVSFGRQDMTLSMNKLTIAAGKMIQSMIDASGHFRDYYYDASLITNDILADRKATCSVFTDALANHTEAPGPYKIPGLQNSLESSDPDSSHGIAGVQFTVDLPMSETLSKKIKEIAYCSEINNAGELVDSKLNDGTPVASCRKL